MNGRDRDRSDSGRSTTRLLTVLTDARSTTGEVQSILDGYDLAYALTDDSDGEQWTITAPVPESAVEPLEDELAEISGEFTLIVEAPMTVVDGRPDRPSRREWLSFERVSRSELRSKARAQLPAASIFAAMTAISAIVATAGVLLDAVTVLVGSMVIAPLLGPAMASSVATVLDDRSLFVTGVEMQLLGIGVAMASTLAFAAFAQRSTVVSAAVDIDASLGLSSHGLPPSLLVTVAVCSGIAGGLGMATTGIADLIGVMIAAAIMPPIGVVGVAVAWGEPAIAIGSFVVVAVNLIAINVGAIGSLWLVGYHPPDHARIRSTRGVILRRVIALSVLLVLTLRVLGSVSGRL